jgi:hypothetical protein
MKLLLSGLNSLLVGGCCAALLVFLGGKPWQEAVVVMVRGGDCL